MIRKHENLLERVLHEVVGHEMQLCFMDDPHLRHVFSRLLLPFFTPSLVMVTSFTVLAS